MKIKALLNCLYQKLASTINILPYTSKIYFTGAMLVSIAIGALLGYIWCIFAIGIALIILAMIEAS